MVQWACRAQAPSRCSQLSRTKQQALVLERVGQRGRQRPAGLLPHADGRGDRLGDEGRVGEGPQLRQSGAVRGGRPARRPRPAAPDGSCPSRRAPARWAPGRAHSRPPIAGAGRRTSAPRRPRSAPARSAGAGRRRGPGAGSKGEGRRPVPPAIGFREGGHGRGVAATCYRQPAPRPLRAAYGLLALALTGALRASLLTR